MVPDLPPPCCGAKVRSARHWVRPVGC